MEGAEVTEGRSPTASARSPTGLTSTRSTRLPGLREGVGAANEELTDVIRKASISDDAVQRKAKAGIPGGLVLPWDTKHADGPEHAAVQQSVDQVYYMRERERLALHTDVASLVLDISGVLSDAAEAVVDDSFWRCFEHNHPEPMNWNWYLAPMWAIGVLIRYLILFPLRLIALLVSWILFLPVFFGLELLMPPGRRKDLTQRKLVQFISSAFLVSWSAAIRYHGPRPTRKANAVWVANHTSMIDYALLCAYTPFAVIMQIHPGWVGFIQKRVLRSLGCIYFNRTEAADRELVMKRMKEHVEDASKPPLLVFPEGTCVNNEYTVMFKRGAFDLGATVCPIAIKYNKVFVDAFWNSRRQSFSNHLFRLMTSWMVVADIYFLEPQNQQPGESTIAFAQRVQAMIAQKAGLKIVPWDGYLKYYRPNPKIVENRRRAFAEALSRVMGWSPKQPADKKEQ